MNLKVTKIEKQSKGVFRAITNFQDLVGENPLTKDFNSSATETLSTQLLFQDPNEENINLSEEEKGIMISKTKLNMNCMSISIT